MFRRATLAAAAVFLGLVACTSSWAASLSTVQSISSGGHTRTFYYYKPDNFDPSKGMIIWLHAGGANGQMSSAGGTDSLWRTLADRVGVLVLFPEGKPYNNDATKHAWNDCSADTATTSNSYTNWDDVGFIKALVPWATSNISSSLDTTRVYAAGHSDGSLMVERLALEANDTIAAAGVIAGNLSVSNDNGGTYRCQGYTSQWALGTSEAVPMFLFKGDADMRIPYGAQSGPDDQTYCQIKDANQTPPCINGAVHSYYDTIAFWQWKLGLSSSPTNVTGPTATTTYADTVPSCTSGFDNCDGSYVVRSVYGSAPYRLIYDRAYGGGHAMPGPDVETQATFTSSGWKNRDALGQPNPYVAEEMWAFFTQFTLAN